jgi:hypothetical protein
MLKCVLTKYAGRSRTRHVTQDKGRVKGCREHGHETLGSINMSHFATSARTTGF